MSKLAITYQVENYLEALPEIKEHYQAHWEEMAMYKDKIPLDMDYSKYEFLAKQELLHLLTVRADGELIGYHISVVSPHLHYKSTLHAMCDIYRLRPDMRKGMTGVRMFK